MVKDKGGFKIFFSVLLLFGLAGFELFNFISTEYGISQGVGSLVVLGVRWSTLIALASCTVDFAGLARIFTPETGKHEPKEVWALYAAWVVTTIMNAILNWFSLSQAIINSGFAGTEVISRAEMLRYFPVFMASFVWLIRVSLITLVTMTFENVSVVKPVPEKPKPAAIPIDNKPVPQYPSFKK